MPTIENLKDSYDLARNYGLDISMPEVNFALSSAALKLYQKKYTAIYKEFQKNMNAIMKDEQSLRNILRKFKKEKFVNCRFSLYKSTGADLFAKASQKRKKFMDNNLATVSPLLDDICAETPWGLDAIVDEDLIRPQTAPGLPENDEGSVEVQNDVRPHTAAPPVTIPSMKQISDNEVENGKQTELSIPESKIAQIDRLLKGLQKEAPNQETSNNDLGGDDLQDNDGEVDPVTERTRARKITITPGKFAELQNGNIHVKLKDKEGEFLLKPLNANYEPTEAEAVFFAKDPTKEKMALVRQKTSFRSSTVSVDLKVNNRIAIQKSLMGMKARKTTVAEIFNNARDRRTRHFRIMLKNPVVSQEGSDQGGEKSRNIDSKNPQHSLQNRRRTSATTLSTSRNGPGVQDTTQKTRTANPKVLKTILRDTSTPGVDKQKRLQIVINTPEDSTQPEKSPPHAQGHKLFQRVRTNSERDDPHLFRYGKATDTSEGNVQDPFNRSHSSMSMREAVQFQASDSHMTEMIRRLVEGKSDNDADFREAPHVMAVRKPVRMHGPKRKHHAGSDTLSNAGSNYSVEPHRRPVTRIDTKNIIRDAIRKDQEYEDAMQSMRRRVALGSGMGLGRRPNSVAGFR